MFEQSAEYYDALYSFKDYKQEALGIHDYIHRRNPNVKSILDVACGTGKHIEFLNSFYSVDGIDLNERFVQIAQERNPASSFKCRDMTSFELNKKYDVVMCLFSAIAYVKTLDALRQTVAQFQNHVTESGFMIIEPWYTPEEWKTGYVSILNNETENYKISRMSHAERDGDLSILNFEYLIGSDKGIQSFKERHELGLFSQKDLLECFKETGMTVDYESKGISGRGIYILS